MPIAHLLGNGPSRKDFVCKPVGDVFGCNLSDFDLPLKASFIMDFIPLVHLYENKIQLPWPIVTQARYKRFVETEIKPRPIVLDFYEKKLKNGESTGHHGFLWLLEHGYDEIHMWGFDSFKKDDVDSDTKYKIPGAPVFITNYIRWRKLWTSLFDTPLAKKAKIEIHFSSA